MILEYKGKTIDPVADDGLQEEQQFDLQLIVGNKGNSH